MYPVSQSPFPPSLPARGAWIEMSLLCSRHMWIARRSPHGERGLKSYHSAGLCEVVSSLPARGAWIEMSRINRLTFFSTSLPARGAWIEIRVLLRRQETRPGRSPHGERGLKYVSRCREAVRRARRSPHGERGLKLARLVPVAVPAEGRSPHGERGLKYMTPA